MTWLDLTFLVLLVLSVIGGYRRGAVLQVIGLTGLVLGIVIGIMLAPRLSRFGEDPLTQIAIALGVVLIGGAVGNLAGWVVGSRVRTRTHGSKMQSADAYGGAVVSVVALLLTTWFLALNLANGPFPQIARGIRDSNVVRGLDAVMPQPPSMIGELQRVLSLLGFPNVFIGLPPIPADPVEPPSGADAEAAYRQAAPSTVEVLGDGCFHGFLNQGSGFVVEPGFVVTNAHVVAGTTALGVRVRLDGQDHPATVVGFDPDLDIAVLRVPTLTAPPLALLGGDLARGDGGAVLGYPGGGALTSGRAAVRQLITPVGHDIYGWGEVSRRLYELQADVAPGNSGGPFVLPNGKVAGLVFANSVVEDHVGYAIVSSEFAPLVMRAVARDEAVSPGMCTPN
ncbi:MAG: MarP family serine protease [Actinomycetota bacterium]